MGLQGGSSLYFFDMTKVSVVWKGQTLGGAVLVEAFRKESKFPVLGVETTLLFGFFGGEASDLRVAGLSVASAGRFFVGCGGTPSCPFVAMRLERR